MTGSTTVMYCPECDGEREFRTEERDQVYKVRGEEIVLRLPLHTCCDCGEWVVDEEYSRDPVAQAYEQYRKRKGLLTPGKIRGIRRRYKLSQRAFAALLGMSQATINRYERGSLQDEAHDAVIRAYARPKSMQELLERRGNFLSKTQLERAQEALAALCQTPAQKLRRLYRRLSEAGLGRRFIESRVLPTGWTDESIRTSGDLGRLIGYLATCLGVEEDILADQSLAIAVPQQPCTLKTRRGLTQEDLQGSKWIAVSAGIAASRGIPVHARKLPRSASALRKRILREDGVKWVDLNHLLDLCWYHAVPVLHIPKLPGKKMDGLAGRLEGRPVIVLCRNTRYSAWLLFHLAHELGHIARGHMQKGHVLVDEKVERESDDREEQEANAFAVELLTGDPETVYEPKGRRLTGNELAVEARKAAAGREVDPGVIAMNYAWGQQFYAVGNAALNIIEPKADAPALIRQKMMNYLEWDLLEDEVADFLRRITRPD